MELVALGVVGGVAALAGVAYAIARRPKIAVVPIAEAAEGVVVQLVGTIAPGETLDAPLTGRPCVHYELELSGPPRTTTRARPHAVTLRPTHAREARSIAFAIDDGTGRALIDPTRARIAVEVSERQMTQGKPSELQRRLTRLHGIPDGAVHLSEAVLVAGDRVAVIGVAVREPDPDGAARATGYRGDSPTRLRLGGSAKRPLVIRQRASGKV